MAVRKAKPIDPNAPKLPPRAQCDAIVRRYLKPDQNIDWRREMPQMYSLYRRYPSVAFWTHYELPFGNGKLNHMSWFDSTEGKDELARAWMLFNYTPPAVAAPVLDSVPSGIDTAPQPAYNAPTPARPRTVAGFLKT